MKTNTIDWSARVDQLLTTIGFVPITSSELKARVPADALLPLLGEPHPDAHFGSGPPSLEAIRAYEDSVAPYYDLKLMSAYELEREVIAYLAGEVARIRPRRVVDAGCGTGLALSCLAALFPRISFVGHDLSKEMMRRARARVRRLNLKNVHCFAAAHEELPERLKPASVDLLFTKCSLGEGTYIIPDFSDAPIPHMARDEFLAGDPTMARWRATLEAFRAVLAPGGIFIDAGQHCDAAVAALADIAAGVGFDETAHPLEKIRDNEPRPPDASEHTWRLYHPWIGAVSLKKRTSRTTHPLSIRTKLEVS